MTKKSQARLQRDAVIKRAQSENITGAYDTLNTLYENQFGLFKRYRDIVALLQSVDPFIVDRPRVETLVNTLDVDMGDLMDKTLATYKQHQGKAGFPKPDDEDEFFHTMQLQQDYMVYMGVHQQILIPILLELDEHLRAALNNQLKQSSDAAAVTAALDNRAIAQAQPEGTSMIDYGNGAVPVATKVVNGMTVRADGLSHSEAAALATADTYEQPAISAQ